MSLETGIPFRLRTVCLNRFLTDGKASAYNAGDLGLIPGLGRSPREGNGNPLQYSCQKNPMDRGAWQATVHGVTKSQTRLKQLNTQMHTHNKAQGTLQHKE